MGKEDKDVADLLQGKMEAEGTNFVLDVENYESCAKTGKRNGKFCEIAFTIKRKNKPKTTHCFDAILLAAGRSPNVTGLQLTKAGVDFTITE